MSDDGIKIVREECKKAGIKEEMFVEAVNKEFDKFIEKESKRLKK